MGGGVLGGGLRGKGEDIRIELEGFEDSIDFCILYERLD